MCVPLVIAQLRPCPKCDWFCAGGMNVMLLESYYARKTKIMPIHALSIGQRAAGRRQGCAQKKRGQSRKYLATNGGNKRTPVLHLWIGITWDGLVLAGTRALTPPTASAICSPTPLFKALYFSYTSISMLIVNAGKKKQTNRFRTVACCFLRTHAHTLSSSRTPMTIEFTIAKVAGDG